MAQSLLKVYIHCVFSTKNGEHLITDAIRKDLHAYIIETLSNIGSFVNEIYANSDHNHVLCSLPRTVTIAELILKIKTSSSKCPSADEAGIKKQGIINFSWQGGYITFLVSSSKVVAVERYIKNQPKHHKKISFRDKLRKFFNEYKIVFNEQYVWD